MDAGTTFSTSVNDTTYNFVTICDHTATSDTGIFQFDTPIYEGTRVNFRYTVDHLILKRGSGFCNNVDTNIGCQSTEFVYRHTTTTYTLNTDYTALTPTSTKYFIQEVEDSRFEVYFGDDVTGKKPSNGNIILLDYVVTNGDEADGASAFTATATVGGYSNVSVLSTANASGGGVAETVDSIKFNAPLKYGSRSCSNSR